MVDKPRQRQKEILSAIHTRWRGMHRTQFRKLGRSRPSALAKPPTIKQTAKAAEVERFKHPEFSQGVRKTLTNRKDRNHEVHT